MRGAAGPTEEPIDAPTFAAMRLPRPRYVVLGLLAVAITLLVVEVAFQIADERRRMGSTVEVVDAAAFTQRHGRTGIRGAWVLLPPGDTFALANVALDGDAIAAVTSADSLVPGYDYLDAAGRYLVPGLIDAHVHLLDSRNDLYVDLAHGVTGAFELYGQPHHLDWRREIAAGEALGPRLYVTSRKIGSREGFAAELEDRIGNHLNWTSSEEVAAGVRAHREAGYDALKLSSFVGPEAFAWIDAEAAAAGLPVVGHLPTEVGLARLYASDVAAVAHVEEIHKNLDAERHAATGTWAYDDPAGYTAYHDSAVAQVARRLADAGVAVMTTVWLGQQIDDQKLGDLVAFHAGLPLDLVNAGVAAGSPVYGGWLPPHNTYAEPALRDDPAELARARAYWLAYERALASTVRALDDAGVTLLAGTDANVAGAVPGDALHRELASLVAAGLSPADALRAATVAPARFAGWRAGEIRAGFAADLVLLRADPLRDIANTRTVERVWAGRHVLDADAIAGLLAAVREANGS